MLKLVIASPEKSFFDGEITRVILPGSEGEFEIRKDHIPFMSSLKSGTILAYLENQEPFALCIDAGIAEISNNQVSIVVDSAYQARIQEKEALLAKQSEYRKQLASQNKADFHSLLTQLSLLSSELEAIGKIRRHRKR